MYKLTLAIILLIMLVGSLFEQTLTDGDTDKDTVKHIAPQWDDNKVKCKPCKVF